MPATSATEVALGHFFASKGEPILIFPTNFLIIGQLGGISRDIQSIGGGFMKKVFLSIFAVMLVSGLSACSKKVKDDESSAVESQNADVNASGDSDSGNAAGLATVRFPYDSFKLEGQDKETLKANAQILKDNTNFKIQVEGHCDDRGGIQYNIALGEKRANAVKNFLVDMGVSGDRITTISFGEERPLDTAQTEAAYAKNRRANFVITSR